MMPMIASRTLVITPEWLSKKYLPGARCANCKKVFKKRGRAAGMVCLRNSAGGNSWYPLCVTCGLAYKARGNAGIPKCAANAGTPLLKSSGVSRCAGRCESVFTPENPPYAVAVTPKGDCLLCERCCDRWRTAKTPGLTFTLLPSSQTNRENKQQPQGGQSVMAVTEEQLNGIPWEFCAFAAVALKAGKSFKWQDLTPDIEREKLLWMTQGFVPHTLSALSSYLKSRSWPLSKCDGCGQSQCGSVPNQLWHTLRPGKVFSYGPEGFGLRFLCTWCMEVFFATGQSDSTIGFCSPQQPVTTVMPPGPPPSLSQLNRRQPNVVIQ